MQMLDVVASLDWTTNGLLTVDGRPRSIDLNVYLSDKPASKNDNSSPKHQLPDG